MHGNVSKLCRAEPRDSRLLIVKRSQTEPIRFHGSPRPIFIVIGAVVRHGAYWTALKNLHSPKSDENIPLIPEPSTSTKKKSNRVKRQKRDVDAALTIVTWICLQAATRHLVSLVKSDVTYDLSPAHDTEGPRSRASFKTCQRWELKWKQTRGFTHLKYYSGDGEFTRTVRVRATHIRFHLFKLNFHKLFNVYWALWSGLYEYLDHHHPRITNENFHLLFR